MKRANRIACAALAAGMGIAGLPAAWADQAAAIGSGNSATANLNFRVIIPVVTRLRIGDPAAINRVQFDLSAGGAPFPGDGTYVTTGNGGTGGFPAAASTAVEVDLLTTAASVAVSQAPTAPNLVGTVPANSIPWTQILIADSGSGFTHSQNGTGLTNTATNIFTGGPGRFNGTWTFSYENANAHAADTYDGTMQYTVTNP